MPRDDDGRILPNAALRGYSTLGAGSRRQFDASMHPAWRRATVLIVGNNVSSIRALSSDMASSLDEVLWQTNSIILKSTDSVNRGTGTLPTGKLHSLVATMNVYTL